MQQLKGNRTFDGMDFSHVAISLPPYRSSDNSTAAAADVVLSLLQIFLSIEEQKSETGVDYSSANSRDDLII